jgi:hypothetical protein
LFVAMRSPENPELRPALPDQGSFDIRRGLRATRAAGMGALSLGC